jgi:prevent-host-death family protein
VNAPAKIKTVNMLEAKTHFSKLVASVEKGDGEVIISRNGKPVARLVPHVEDKPKRSLIGIAKGQFDIDWDAWDAMDEEIAEMFNNSKIFPDEE